MTARFRIAAAAALLCALAGCVEVVDADRARTCRSVIPALNLGQDELEILRTTALAPGDGVRIDYRVGPTGRPSRERFVECRFAGSASTSADRSALVGVTTEAGPLGEVRLRLLKRFWLEAEGVAADPEPVGGATRARALPLALAIGLQHLLLALPAMAIYGLLAAAYSLIYGLVGRINLAFGELAAVGGYAAFLGVLLAGGSGGGMGGSLLLALALALTAAVSYGIAAGRFVFQELAAQTGQRVLIGTLALAIVLQEFLRLAQGSKHQWVPPMLNTPHAVARAGGFVVTVTPMALGAALLSLLAAVGLLGLMQASRFGRSWRACADDPGAAALFGIDRTAVLLKTFALGSGLAGLAGYVVTIYYGTLGYAGGVVLGLKALLAAVAGGIGSVAGAFLGGLLLGCAEALWSAVLPIEYRDLGIFALLVLLLVARPYGLWGLADLQPRRP